MNKKGTGMIQGLVMGVAALIISVIIAFIIVDNVSTVSDDIAADLSGSATAESLIGVNGTTYTVTQASLDGFTSFSVKKIYNATITIGAGNYTVGSTGTIVGTVGRTANYTALSIDYSYTHTPTVTSANQMIGNFTEGIDNVSSKIPTVLLIAAVVLILGLLVVLWSQYQRMQMGGSAEL